MAVNQFLSFYGLQVDVRNKRLIVLERSRPNFRHFYDSSDDTEPEHCSDSNSQTSDHLAQESQPDTLPLSPVPIQSEITLKERLQNEYAEVFHSKIRTQNLKHNIPIT